MPAFVIAAFAMVCLALGVLLLPLLRKPRKAWPALESTADGVIVIYRDRMKDLERDFASGALSEDRRRESEQELERSILDELSPTAVPTAGRAWRRSPKTALGVLALLPLAAAALYWKLGNPGAIIAPADPAAAHVAGHATTPASIAAMVDALARKLERNPDNPEGWAMLARSLVVLQRNAEALPAFEKAVALVPADAELLADYADAAAVAQQGRLAGKPMQLVRRALRADAANPKALALAGTDAFDRRNYQLAGQLWEKALAAAPGDSEFADSLRANLDEVRGLAGKAGLANAMAQGTRSATGSQVSGRIRVSADLKDRIPGTGTLFIYARAAAGPRMPVAILRGSVRDLPAVFVLDDRASMSPDRRISAFRHVIVTARISLSGDAMPSSGDLIGESGPVAVGTGDLVIEINRIVR